MKRLFILLVLISPSMSFATDPELELINQYRKILGESPAATEAENNTSSKVVTDYDSFLARLKSRLGAGDFSVLPVAGFSGAGYENAKRLETIFELELNQLNNDYSRTHHSGTVNEKLVVILGGSTDGIGMFYDLIKKLKDSRKYKDVIVVGIVKSKVIEYEIEGRSKGWNTLSTEQDLLLLQKTKSANWEVLRERGTSANVDIIMDLGNMENCKKVNYTLFEGGEVALKEAIEVAVRTNELSKTEKLEMSLFPTYEPSPKKVATGKDLGFRAATQTALALFNHQLSAGKKVYVGIVNPNGMNSFFLENMDKHYDGKDLLKKVSNASDPELLEKLKAELQKLAGPAGQPVSEEYNITKAKIAIGENLRNTTAITIDVLKRISKHLKEQHDSLGDASRKDYSYALRKIRLNQILTLSNKLIQMNEPITCRKIFFK